MKRNFKIEGDEAIIKINKNIYSKDILIQTTYVKIEDFYFLIDEDEKDYIVSMRFKEEGKTKEQLERGVYEFFDELIESASYIDQLKRTAKVRETILERALLGQSFEDIEKKKEDYDHN